MTDTIGTQLKRARQHRNLTLEKAAEATRIRPGYLQALEADDYSAMPSPVHARGFLRNYAQYLDLDLDQIVDELRVTQQEKESRTEQQVHFEGDQLPPSLSWEQVQPIIETEETSAEPFWQTWLRRAKRETEGLAQPGEPTAELLPPAPSPPKKKTSPTQVPPSPNAQPGDNQPKLAQATAPTRPNVAPVPGQAAKTEAARPVESAWGEKVPETEKKASPWILLLERIQVRFPRKATKAVPTLETVEKPEPGPEPEVDSGPPTEPGTSSQQIINEIGLQLRRRREMLSLTLDEIERHTRLRAEVMEALERGSFDDLPSPVQTRGMLANYAGFLDLEVDALLLRYADALQARHRERHPAKPARRRGEAVVPKSLPPFRTFIAGDVVFGIGMILLLIGFSVWGISRVIAYQSEQGSGAQVEASGPSISEALIGTPVETVESDVTLIAVEDTPIPEATTSLEDSGEVTELPALESSANIQVNVVALERSFLRVIVDGEVAFEGRTIPGNAYTYEADQSIEVLAGNGAALRVIYNQRDMGLLGGFGQIASFIYTAEEVLVPTPAMSPTVTSTPFISPTPSITPSPTTTPSPTFTPSDVGVEA